MLYNRVLVQYGEIALKGRNRPAFQRRLLDNIRSRLNAEGLDWKIARQHHRVVITLPDTAPDELENALSALGEVAGVVWYAPCRFVPVNNFDAAALDRVFESLLEMARHAFAPAASFAVRARRPDKNVPLRSQDIEREAGRQIREHTAWERVDLDKPDCVFNVVVDTDGAWLYHQRREGPGGLPVGTVGRVVSLLSGGLDSPVASFLAARRGCQVDFVHFTASRMQQMEARNYKVASLAKQLSRVTLDSKLWLVPYIHFDTALIQHGNTNYSLVLFRRFMMRVAEKIALDSDAKALVTGDNLGQVASQTLDNIVTTTQSVAVPILRPLLTYDKQEIMALARRIGTYEVSIQPYKDCCALIDRHPRTTSRHNTLERIESQAFENYDKLISKTLEDALILEYKCGRVSPNERPR